MKYNKKLLRYIKKNFEYLDYLGENLYYQTTNSAELRICCPFCGESDYKMYVNPEKYTYICFKCDKSTRNSDVFNFIAAVENISVGQAIANTVAKYREVTPDDLETYALENDEEEITKEVPSFKTVKAIDEMPEDAIKFSSETEEALPYLQYMYNRGFTLQDCLDCQMYYVPKEESLVYKNGKCVGNIGQRVIWPVYGGKTDLVSWIARSIREDLPKKTPKYINAPDTELAKTVWPFVPPATKDIVLVEGIIDAYALRKAGYNSYATFGKKLSKEQISLLQHWEVESITVFLDNNAKREIKSSVNALQLLFKNIYVVDVSWWPTNSKGEIQDSGFMLAHPDGMTILNKTLTNRINVTNEWEFAKWSLT